MLQDYYYVLQTKKNKIQLGHKTIHILILRKAQSINSL